MQDRGILKGRATDTEEETERIRGGDNTEMATWTLFSKEQLCLRSLNDTPSQKRKEKATFYLSMTL